ncbi:MULTISPECIES: hypothetical protein [unclassified Coleofasciculus]|uniref:hypothetical protein n=1 Tax=unclassified Coleofasciculus TaxID=2692782 RepID=UPI0018822317|nr:MULTISPECIES: hypothetical protein [unclassified Coleofasciculus]MBE9128031.1 hypothetical protein [Coleofasciculus sp. LEGE 07081]MBE9150529.1 hypothetical protein [Coleofasciculus sp. LEGE 07092]
MHSERVIESRERLAEEFTPTTMSNSRSPSPSQPEVNPMLIAVSIPMASFVAAGIVLAIYPSILFAVFIFLFTGLFCVVYVRFYLKQQQRQRSENPQPNSDKFVNTQAENPRQKLQKRQQILKQLLHGKVIKAVEKSSAQQGVSEKDFFEVLHRFFPAVTFGDAFPIPGTDYSYSTDFSLIHETGVSIDIEVDEPYEGRSLQPHHCVDDGKDQRRNQFFLERNWIVVRFAEIQVVKYPYECAAVVGQVLAIVTGDENYLLPSRKPVPPVKLWTKAEARKMARQKFRQSYLPGQASKTHRSTKRRR